MDEKRLQEIENIAANAPWDVLVELIAEVRSLRSLLQEAREHMAIMPSCDACDRIVAHIDSALEKKNGQ